MATRYRNRERRLQRTISRIETARRTIAGHAKSASEHEAWWLRHGGTLEAWQDAIEQRQRRQPTASPAIAADRFTRWASGLRWHPRVLRLRFACWWLTLRLGMRSRERGPRA
jgi:hypothetical protein